MRQHDALVGGYIELGDIVVEELHDVCTRERTKKRLAVARQTSFCDQKEASRIRRYDLR